MSRTNPPQAFISSFAPRLRAYGNALLTPVVPQATQLPNVRTTKRGTTAINYAEDGFEDDEFEDSEGPRRPTGLRSLRRAEPAHDAVQQASQLGKEVNAPVDLQGIWREWMAKPGRLITEKQQQIQCVLPLTLVPIRIDVDIASFRPDPPLPAPQNPSQYGIDDTQPAYRPGEPTPAYRLKDAFLWNLHEALTTPDKFARTFVEELDFPAERKTYLVAQISNQIRSQLEDYAGVALHPLFQPEPSNPSTSATALTLGTRPGIVNATAPPSLASTDGGAIMIGAGRLNSNGHDDGNRNGEEGAALPSGITATAAPASTASADPLFNPDDTYRCIVNLNVNLLNKLYTDKFEWSLVHPPGLAEAFSRQTCADLGLGSEWVMAMSHAIYEAVLRLKKDVCENGGLLLGHGELDNETAFGSEAGVRFEPEFLGETWEPKLEELSKDEIEKREGDRERQLRRARRETARFSTTANIGANDYFGVHQDNQEQAFGRGERTKKKRRFRSLSPLGGDTPDTSGQGGYGGEASKLAENERTSWRCAHCWIWGSSVWAVRDGPEKARSLCHNCGFLYERDKTLPPWSKEFFRQDSQIGGSRR